MKQVLMFLIVLLPTVIHADSWTRKVDFPGNVALDGFAFGIGTKGFVGGGCCSNEFWEYDAISGTWTQKSNLPFSHLTYSIGFSINSKGYMWGGGDTALWEYDTATDIWSHKLNTALTGLNYLGGSFVIGKKAYISTVHGRYYIYDPLSNSIDSTPILPIVPQNESFSFAMRAKGYVIIPFSTDTMLVFQYNPSLNSWSQNAVFAHTPRGDANAMTIGNIGYFGTGDIVTSLLDDWWEFQPDSNNWVQKTSAPPPLGLDQNVTFVADNKGYILFGCDAAFDASVWEYTPDSISTVEVSPMSNSLPKIKVAPNPFSKSTVFQFDTELKNATLSITDIYGKKVAYRENICGIVYALQRDGLASGIYFYTFSESGNLLVRDKLLIE